MTEASQPQQTPSSHLQPPGDESAHRTGLKQRLSRYHVLAIVSFLLSLTGFTFLPIFGWVGAIVTGKMALADMHQHPGEYKGELLARLGVWFGWLGFILAAAILILVVAILYVTGSSLT